MSLTSSREFTYRYDILLDVSQSVKTLGVVAIVLNDMIRVAEGTLLYFNGLTAFAGYVLSNSCSGELPA